MTDQERLAELLGKDAWKIFTCGVCKDTHIIEFDGELVECEYCDCEQSMTHFLKPPEELIEIAEERLLDGLWERQTWASPRHLRFDGQVRHTCRQWINYNFDVIVRDCFTEDEARMACAIKALERMQAESATGKWVPTDNPSAPEYDAE